MKKRINVYIPEALHNDIKDYLVDNQEFKTISEMVSVLLRRYIDNEEVLEESKIAQIEKDLKATNRHSRILMQQMTTLLKKQDAVPTDLYKDSYFYKKAVEIIDDDFKNKKMNHKPVEDRKENKQTTDDIFKNIYG
uniref:ribbon-helix-helix domain-containing protein n=1 Tax=Enterococcus hirae TaxID=1354 RepID=UPI0015EF1242|nr:ribbon-helix-helix domain-containing protein [Enterococcus hirae]